MKLSIRWPRKADFPGLAELLNGAYPFEQWTETDLQQFLDRPLNHIKMVEIETLGGVDRHVRAVALYTLTDVCRLRRLAVETAFRREGVGRFTIEKLMTGPRARIRCDVLARIPKRDPRARAFLEALGFTETARNDKIEFRFRREL